MEGWLKTNNPDEYEDFLNVELTEINERKRLRGRNSQNKKKPGKINRQRVEMEKKINDKLMRPPQKGILFLDDIPESSD